jgi:transcriptional regulator with XRE-family HTH domain
MREAVNMNSNVSIGNKVKRLRNASRLSQSKLAEFLGVDRRYLSKLERGERQFDIPALEKVSNLFGCLLVDLINSDEPETMNYNFRPGAIASDNLNAIAEINRIALNIREMSKLSERQHCE